MAVRCLLTACLWLMSTGVCSGQSFVIEQSSTISRLTVSGSGQVKAMPDTVVMLSGVSGEAELAQDAVIKYRDAKRRAIESLDALGIEHLEVKPMGMSLGARYDEQVMNMIRSGDPRMKPKPAIVAAESLRLTIAQIGDMEPQPLSQVLSTLVEAVQDAGLSLGSPEMTQMMYGYGEGPMKLFIFQLDDPEPSIAEARRLAVADARRHAESLALEAGVELGRVLSVSEAVVDRRFYGGNSWQYYAQAMGIGMNAGSSTPIMSESFCPVTVQVQVSMSFEIVSEP